MRDRVRESALTSLLASKRFVVSVCAAIAMVLGAVSAGASVFTGTSADAQTGRPVNAVFKETPGSPSATSETPLFTQRQTLASQDIAVQPPLYTADTTPSKDKKGLNLKLSPDVVKTTNTNALFYKPEAMPGATDMAPLPVTPVEPAATTPPETQASTTTEPPAQPADAEPQQPATSAPSGDPTTEPSLNNVAPQPTDDTKQS